jgi:hypothetical protein
VIKRFSEDIDLSVSPSFLGMSEESLEQTGGRTKRAEWMKKLEAACIECVRDRFLPEMERIAMESLGPRTGGLKWMEFQEDFATHSPVVLFHYPSNEPTGFDYLSRSVKMEFGSLTDQRPVGIHPVRPWVAEEFPTQFADFRCELVALELERTFWEKATILHAEHHRDRAKTIRDRFSRHYSDMAALSSHAIAERALGRMDLLERVANWKSRFFAASWARYDSARAGTFRLTPPEFRLAELEHDYQAMKDMFLGTPPSFESVIKTISDLEREINKKQPA